MHRQLLIAALTLTFSCGLTASAATLTFKYNTSDKTATITGWTGSEPTDELRIPLQSTNPDDGIKYKVTAVAPGVFNDLDKITSVYIRKNIMTIGGCTGNDRISYGVGLANFYNCPNIQFFEVEEGNQYFKNTGIGMLVSADGSILYRVPSDCDTDANGRISLAASITTIKSGAFSGNRTISTLAIPKGVNYIEDNPGFNYMTALSRFEADPFSTTFVVDDDCLYWLQRDAVVSLPPLSAKTSFTLPLHTTDIHGGAFANCTNLREIKYNRYINDIGDFAFAGSGIVNAEIPATADYHLGKYAFANCPNLTSIVVHAPGAAIPNNFARDSKALRSVTFDADPNSIGNSAFFGCTSLSEFPFLPDIVYGDSAFARTGFEKVEFLEGPYYERMAQPKALFFNCRNLTTIDFSKIHLDDDALYYWEFFDGFASFCPNLATVIFPPSFHSEGTPFAGCNALKKVFLQRFYAFDQIFSLSGYQTFSPDIYYTLGEYTTEDLFNEDRKALQRLFRLDNGATLNANIYMGVCDPIDIILGDSATGVRGPGYVIPGCTYYIPGHSDAEYRDAPRAVEMFELTFENNTVLNRGYMRSTWQIDGVTLRGCIFNRSGEIHPFNFGLCTPPIPYGQIHEIEVLYTVNGVDMSTVYPDGFFSRPSSSVPDASASADGPWTIFSLSGITLLQGSGAPDTSTLAPGAYILQTPSETSKIFIQ